MLASLQRLKGSEPTAGCEIVAKGLEKTITGALKGLGQHLRVKMRCVVHASPLSSGKEYPTLAVAS